MRTSQQIASMRARMSDPYVVEDFLNPQDVIDLVDLFRKNSAIHEVKHTGPITLGVQGLLEHPVMVRVLSRMQETIGPFGLNAGLFFETSTPHVIHNDDVYSLPNTHKAFTIPLEITGFSGVLPGLCFFDQFYFKGPAKFFKGSANIPAHFNTSVYDYSDVDGLQDRPVDDETYRRYFTHLRPSWLEGLSLHSVLEWKPGTAIVFDSLRLHCATDFRKLGVVSKLGLSMFTHMP